MRRLVQTLRSWAEDLDHALITGESGVGKSLVARVLHMASSTSRSPLLICRASDVGGVAHPWATAVHHGGTVVLDGLEHWPIPAQETVVQQLLTRPASAPGVRVLGTSRASRSRLMLEARLHPKLAQQWSSRVLHIPPLRTRPDDLPPLVRVMVQRLGRASVCLTPEAWRALSAHGWPDNVRELRDVIDRTLTRTAQERLEAGHLALDPLAPPALEAIADQPFDAMRTKVDTWYLRRLLHQTDGNISEAARRAGCSRKVLRDRLRRHGLYSAPAGPKSSPPTPEPSARDHVSVAREPGLLGRATAAREPGFTGYGSAARAALRGAAFVAVARELVQRAADERRPTQEGEPAHDPRLAWPRGWGRPSARRRRSAA